MTDEDVRFMRRALNLARRAAGDTSPNPIVGAVLVRHGQIIGEGWHRCAGDAHAEIAALHDAQNRGNNPRGATLYVTLEPCCTHGRTPPCTAAIQAAKIRRVVVGAIDPNPAHAGHGLNLLQARGIEVVAGVLGTSATALNGAFNHWIVHHTPLVTLKVGLTLDGKIATAQGESKWITNDRSRTQVLRLRQQQDAVMVGVNTVLLDDPSLLPANPTSGACGGFRRRRIVLDSKARTPVNCRLATDAFRENTLVVVGASAPAHRVSALRQQVNVLTAPLHADGIDLAWLMRELGQLPITSLLVEGGGEVHASFLTAGLAHRAAFFYAAKILGGDSGRRAVAGLGFTTLLACPHLTNLRTRRFDNDLLLTADFQFPRP